MYNPHLSLFFRASTSAVYFCMTTSRRTFMLRVRVSFSALKGSFRISNAAMRSCGGRVADTLASSAFTMLCFSASDSCPEPTTNPGDNTDGFSVTVGLWKCSKIACHGWAGPITKQSWLLVQRRSNDICSVIWYLYHIWLYFCTRTTF